MEEWVFAYVFSIDNRFWNVSLNQFKKTAGKLEYFLRQVRPSIQSELLLTTNQEDYMEMLSKRGAQIVEENCSLEMIERFNRPYTRREHLRLNGLNKDLWEGSFKRELIIKDSSVNENYMIGLTNEFAEPNILFFYGQWLDKRSEGVLMGFRRAGLFQKVGNGRHRNWWSAFRRLAVIRNKEDLLKHFREHRY